MASSPEMNCCMRPLRPSNAADMLANMGSPPIAGTNFAHRIVAIGGSVRNVSSQCQTAVADGGVVSFFLNLVGADAFSFGGAEGWRVNSGHRRPKSIRLSDVIS